MESLILHIKNETITDKWKNGKCACFIYNRIHRNYQLVELTSDAKSYLISPMERTEKNCPVLANGFIAYLIRNWGTPELEIFEGYYGLNFSEYNQIENTKPGAFRRDLKSEFVDIHLTNEKAKIIESIMIYSFLTIQDAEAIKEYVNSYFDFLAEKGNTYRSDQVQMAYHELPANTLMIHPANGELSILTGEEAKHYQCDDSVLGDLYDLSRSLFLSDKSTFCKSVHIGDFSDLKINKGGKTRLQHVIYRLSGYMGNDWYTAVCSSMNWMKSQCSKPYDPQSHKNWGYRIEKALPKEPF
jgi:hypothetical protein